MKKPPKNRRNSTSRFRRSSDRTVRSRQAPGRRLRRAVRGTRYVKERWTLHSSVPAAVLREFGSRAGLCEISQKGADDRDVIKEILFSCDREGTQSTHYRRRMSLLLLLHAIGETAKIGAGFDRQTFSDLTYYGRVVTDEERHKSTAIDIPAPLRDAAERWRIFHFPQLSNGSAAIPSGIHRRRAAPPSGGYRPQPSARRIQVSALGARFRKLFETELPGSFFDLAPGELLGVADISVADALAGRASALAISSIGSKFGERNLADLLIEGEAEQTSGIALASMLLYAVLLRYQTSVETAYDAWYQNLVQDRFADLSVPGVLGTLRSGIWR